MSEELWNRPSGMQEHVKPDPPRLDPGPIPAGPTRDTDHVDIEIHRLATEMHPLVVDREHCPPGGWQFNPSLCVHAGRLFASVRLYIDGCRRENVLGEVAPDWTLVRQRTLKSRALEPAFKLLGFEDLRLFTLGRRMHAFASVYAKTQDGVFRSLAAILDFDEELTAITDAHYQQSPSSEKNWMPIVTGDRVRFVYQTEPRTIVLDYDQETHRVTPAPPGSGGMIRGGSQLLPLPDGRYLACVHENRRPIGRAVGRYVHRFVLFGSDLRLQAKSEMFIFRETGIEFCGGIAMWEGKLVLSVGLQDKEAWLAVMDLNDALLTVGAA